MRAIPALSTHSSHGQPLAMSIETLKIPVHELAKGMHVVKLDRPWLETPFKLQGFRIQNSAELRVLEKYCKHVYVDIERSSARPAGKGQRVTLSDEGEIVQGTAIHTTTSPRATIRTDGGRGDSISGAVQQTSIPAPDLSCEIESNFEDELGTASGASANVKVAVKNCMHRLKHGSRADLGAVKRAAAELEASVLRNPDAAMVLRALPSDEPFSYRHCANSAILAIVIARDLGFRRQRVHELAMGVLLFDIGKMRLPKELLQTPRRLEANETEIIKLHVKYGVEMAAALDGLTPGTIEIIAAHHERFNGSGYPKALRGGQIPLLARIAGLVDSFDTMTSQRAYADAIPIYDVVQEMYAATVDVFQRDLVERLIQVLGTYPLGSLVELSDISVALVVALNRHRRLLPKVILLRNASKKPVNDIRILDLAADAKASLTVSEIVDEDVAGIERPDRSILVA